MNVFEMAIAYYTYCFTYCFIVLLFYSAKIPLEQCHVWNLIQGKLRKYFNFVYLYIMFYV